MGEKGRADVLMMLKNGQLKISDVSFSCIDNEGDSC